MAKNLRRPVHPRRLRAIFLHEKTSPFLSRRRKNGVIFSKKALCWLLRSFAQIWAVEEGYHAILPLCWLVLVTLFIRPKRRTG
jgi:hypothetical protein